MNRIIVENDLNKNVYDDDMQPGCVRLADQQQQIQHQFIQVDKDVQPMMVTVDSCTSMDDFMVIDQQGQQQTTPTTDKMPHLQLHIKTTDLMSAATHNPNCPVIMMQVANNTNPTTPTSMAMPCSPLPSVCMSCDCGTSTVSGSEFCAVLSDVTEADVCGVMTEESRVVMEIAATEEGSWQQAKPCESDFSEMKDPAYWKDVSQFKQAVFDKFNARFISLDTNTEDVVKMFLRESNLSEDPFYVLDLSRLVRQYMQWRELLPRVTPFYAVKCNDSPIIVQVLDYLGCSFDCASQKEIDLVKQLANSLDQSRPPLDPKKRIIFANPCKQISHCRYAYQAGVEMTTVDNEHELRKLKTHWPTAKVVIRIKTDDSMSLCQFSTKFGASVEQGDAERLVALCSELGLTFHGVSFHVGSGCQSAQSFVAAIRNARKLFDIGIKHGFNPKFLDIGGGFPGSDGQAAVDFSDIAHAVRPALDELFESDVEVIGEPGRYFACAPYTLVCNVFAKRDKKPAVGALAQQSIGAEVLYYINDGVYGGFNCIMFDHAHPELNHLPAASVFDESGEARNAPRKQRLSTVFGPTCDSADKICDTVPMPDMEVGDYVYVKQFGAYTLAPSTSFNGFKVNQVRMIWKN